MNYNELGYNTTRNTEYNELELLKVSLNYRELNKEKYWNRMSLAIIGTLVIMVGQIASVGYYVKFVEPGRHICFVDIDYIGWL